MINFDMLFDNNMAKYMWLRVNIYILNSAQEGKIGTETKSKI